MLLYEVDGKKLSATQAFVYLTDKLAFANARIAELGDELHTAKIDADGLRLRVEVLEAENKQANADKISWRVGAHAQRTLTEHANARIAELEAQLAKPATIHEVIDDFGTTVTAVTL